MNVKIEELINQVGTDVSGKWLRIDNAEMLVKLVVKECADVINSMDQSSQYFPHVADAINEHFGVDG